MRGRTVLILGALCLVLAVSGCRARVIPQAELADRLILLPQEVVSPTPSPTPTPAVSPSPRPSEEPREPEVTVHPTEEPGPASTRAPAEAPSAPVGESMAPEGSPAPGQSGEAAPPELAGEEPAPTEQPTPTEQPADPPPTAAPLPQSTPVPRAATVSFSGNGGRVKSREERITLREGEPFGSLPTPLREGYDFLGWYTDPEAGEEITGESVFSPAEDLTLYAHWHYDPMAYWTFVLENKTQQVYLCQQTSIYFETEEANVTRSYVELINATGSLNLAAGREDPAVPDDWILAKNPSVVLKAVGSMAGAYEAQASVQARIPGAWVIVVSEDALYGGASGLYAELALGKALYGDWYTDVDLAAAAAELGVSQGILLF